jgi:hypothetical protein
MRNDTLNPPALSRQVESLADLKAHALSLAREIERNDRMNLQRAAELGRTLDRIYGLCDRGEWGRFLAETAISTQRASEWRRIAKLSSGELEACHSIRDALRYLDEQNIGESEQTSDAIPSDTQFPGAGINLGLCVPENDSPQTEDKKPPALIPLPSTKGVGKPSSSPVAGMAPPPKAFSIRCERCERKGLSGANCTSCIEMRLAAKNRPDREPGDDDDCETPTEPLAPDAGLDVPLPDGRTPRSVNKKTCPECGAKLR